MHEKGFIPIPALQRWWRVRTRVVPVLLLVVAVGLCLLIWRANFASGTPARRNLVCSDITSPVSGKVTELNVEPLQRVYAGGVIARILATDPQVLQASLKKILSEISVLRIRAQAAAFRAKDRATTQWLQLDLMEERVGLVMAQAGMESASAELVKVEGLWARGVGSLGAAKAAASRLEQLRANAEERAQRVSKLGRELAHIKASEGESSPDQNRDLLAAAIQRQEERLRQAEAELIPVELRVECEGTITAIHRRSGDRVVAGQPVATVTIGGPGPDETFAETPRKERAVSHDVPARASEVSRPFGPPPTAPRIGPVTVRRSVQVSL